MIPVRRPAHFLPVLLGLVLASLIFASAASARAASLSCRASAVRLTLGTSAPLEPFVANGADTPCKSAHVDVLTPPTVGSGVSIGAVNVATTSVRGVSAAASSRVASVTIGSGTQSISATVLDAKASYVCRAGVPTATTSGTVTTLTVGGNPVVIPPGTNQVVPLGALGSITLNEVTHTGNTVTRRALDVNLTGVGRLVVSEATADYSGDPCAGAARLVISPRHTAKLIAAGKCVRSFRATVAGTHIRRVVFKLDRRVLAIRTKSPFTAEVHASPGAHRLVARVTFTAASGTRPRNLTRRFIGCAGPSFTG